MFDRNLFKLPGMGAIMGALVVLALLQAAAIVGQAFFLSSALAALWAGDNLAGQLSAVCAFFACFAVHRLLRFAQDTMLDRFSQNAADALHRDLLAQVFRAGSGTVRERGSASVAAAATQGIDDVQSYVRIIPPKVVGMAAISVPLFACTLVADWPSGVILGVMFPVIMFFMMLLGRQAQARAERQYESYNRLSNHFLDTLRGLDAIVASGAQAAADDDVFESSENLRRATVRTLSTATLSSAVLDLCAMFGVAAVAMMLAFRLMDGSVPLATGLFALILAPEYFAPIRAFATDFHASLDGKNALAAVLDIVERGERKHMTEDLLAQPSAALELEGVSYTYPDAEGPAVRSVSLRVERGEHVAVVGPSGSGKSTLAALTAGLLQPESGAVLAGAPVHFIPQHPYLFRASLLDNVRFYCPDAPREDAERAIRAVGLQDLLDEPPDGLDSMIGEGNRGLSGGQAHRVALARVLLDPSDRVLVFDEPTAHLDIETELELKARMLPLLEGRTVLFATHRLHWIGDMDRVCVLDHGHVSHIGPAADVLEDPQPLAAVLADIGDGDAA